MSCRQSGHKSPGVSNGPPASTRARPPVRLRICRREHHTVPQQRHDPCLQQYGRGRGRPADGGRSQSWARPPPRPRELRETGATKVLQVLLANCRLPNLVTLHFDEPLPPHSAIHLPDLPSLRSLTITPDRNFVSTHPPSLITFLANSPLFHLSLGHWPSPELLASLPPSIELLHFNVNGDVPLNAIDFEDDKDFVLPGPGSVELIADVKYWKQRHVPALRAVRIDVGNPSRRPLVPYLIDSLVTEVREREGFEVVKGYDDRWLELLPPEWRCDTPEGMEGF